MEHCTEEKVRELQDHTIVFIELLNQYMRARSRVEYRFPCHEIDLHDQDEDVSFDIEYMHSSFPLSDLWDPKWVEQMEKEGVE